MEESVTCSDFLEYYKKSMGLEPVDVRTYSPLVRAYIGDAVYELMIRSKVINHGSMQVNKMHKHSAALVKASAQAQLIKALQEELTEEELEAVRNFTMVPKGNGIGLKNIRERLNLIFSDAVFEITSQPGKGTVVRIEIPKYGGK